MTDERTPEEAIRATLAGYCQFCDDGRFDEWGELFTDDARFLVMGRVYEGRPAIKAFMDRAQPPERRGKHLAGSSLLEVEGEQARAWSDYVFVTRMADGTFAVTSVGRYHDELVCEGGRWRFRSREIVFLGDEPQPPAPG